jgi:hypothetical protein
MTHRNAAGRIAALAGIACTVAFVACGDPYLHTNPYDPAVSVSYSFTGPDTLFSLGQVAQYRVQTTPAFPDSAFIWVIDTAQRLPVSVDGDTTVDGTVYASNAGNGAIQVRTLPLEPASTTIGLHADIGTIDTLYNVLLPGVLGGSGGEYQQFESVRGVLARHIGTKLIVMMQRVTRIQLRCPETHACDTLSAGGTWSVWVDGFDALNRQIATLTSSTANPASGPPVVTYAVRDTTIAHSSPVGIRSTTITALKSGTTWVVATRGALLDSLQLVVQ